MANISKTEAIPGFYGKFCGVPCKIPRGMGTDFELLNISPALPLLSGGIFTHFPSFWDPYVPRGFNMNLKSFGLFIVFNRPSSLRNKIKKAGKQDETVIKSLNPLIEDLKKSFPDLKIIDVGSQIWIGLYKGDLLEGKDTFESGMSSFSAMHAQTIRIIKKY